MVNANLTSLCLTKQLSNFTLKAQKMAMIFAQCMLCLGVTMQICIKTMDLSMNPAANVGVEPSKF